MTESTRSDVFEDQAGLISKDYQFSEQVDKSVSATGGYTCTSEDHAEASSISSFRRHQTGDEGISSERQLSSTISRGGSSRKNVRIEEEIIEDGVLID